jgi:histidinol-phosphate/aromatic aminotransferase/cobyric acid decarboxylase-like protein
MVQVADKTLIERAVLALKAANINRLIMVVGYQKENLKSFIAKNISDMEIVYIDNDNYNNTNNIYSLYLAKEWLTKDDTILLESDLIYEDSIISDLVNCKYKNVVTVAKYEQWMDGTVITVDNSDTVIDFIEKKDFIIDNINNYYKTVNIYKFSKEFSQKQYIPFLEAYIKAYGENEYYELALKAIAHLSRSNLKALKLENKKWYEIDDAQDLDIANCMFSNSNDMLHMYHKRFGGYWRFKDVKDYCYLVNPYFPPNSMIDKINYFSNQLICQYPSGMDVQNLNAARIFGIDESEILVGNGAAELINVIGRISTGKVAVSVPTFNEYVRCFPNCDIQPIPANETNYSFDVPKMLDMIDSVDTMVIINPDNPSGSFIQYDDIIKIIDKCHEQNKRILIDESFADFANEEVKYTLISSAILQKYKNLIVIKSISKSYGVPGIRLGIMASGDSSLLKRIRENLAVWNINSFAEYFMQIFTLYQNDYRLSCNKICKERNRMYEELNKITFLKVYPSEANYFLCQTINVNSTKLANWLLMNYNILIKDLSGKNGFQDGEYIRLAVKNKEDNDFLLGALNQYSNNYRD